MHVLESVEHNDGLHVRRMLFAALDAADTLDPQVTVYKHAKRLWAEKVVNDVDPVYTYLDRVFTH